MTKIKGFIGADGVKREVSIAVNKIGSPTNCVDASGTEVAIVAEKDLTFDHGDYSITFNDFNFANLARLVHNPTRPVADGDVLITNGQVYKAITPMALSAHKAEGGASFPLAANTDDTALLDNFIENVAKESLHPVILYVDDAEEHIYAAAFGYAKWVDGTVQETADVIVYIGAGIEFKANCQLGHDSTNTWATNWSVSDKSSSFVIGGQS